MVENERPEGKKDPSERSKLRRNFEAITREDDLRQLRTEIVFAVIGVGEERKISLYDLGQDTKLPFLMQ